MNQQSECGDKGAARPKAKFIAVRVGRGLLSDSAAESRHVATEAERFRYLVGHVDNVEMLAEALADRVTYPEPERRAAEYSELQAGRRRVLAWVREWVAQFPDDVRYPRLLSILESCGEGRMIYFCPTCRRVEVREAFCGSRICPVCTKRRADKFKANRADLVEGYRYPFHLVITQRVSAGRSMSVAFRRLRERLRAWKKREDVRDVIGAGVYSIEIASPHDKPRREGRYVEPAAPWYHVHIHAIVDSRRVEPKETTRRITYAEKKRVDGKKVKTGRLITRSAAGLMFESDLDTLKQAWSTVRGGSVLWIGRLSTSEKALRLWLSEVIKYLYKPHGFGESELRELFDTLYHARFGGTWGKSYGSRPPAEHAAPICGYCDKQVIAFGYNQAARLVASDLLARSVLAARPERARPDSPGLIGPNCVRRRPKIRA